MSGIIARAAGDGFQGREVRQHAFPSELGKALWHLYREPFKQKRLHMLEVLIEKHPAGWDDLAISSWTHVDQPPACLCHGSHTIPERLFTETTPGDHQWCYRVGVTTLYKAFMDVLYRPAHQSEWHRLGSRILLNQPEPNWFVYEALAANVEIQPSGPPCEEDVEQQACAIETWAQEQGPDTAVWFQAPLGVRILVSPDLNKTNGWLSSTFLPIWGSAMAQIHIASRLEGIRMALNDGAQVQAEP